jgi:hypothetical protein
MPVLTLLFPKAVSTVTKSELIEMELVRYWVFKKVEK